MEYKKVQSEINNVVNDNVKILAQLFPSAVKDGEVDFKALKEELGQFDEVSSEKYELTWAGKQNAKKMANEDVVGKTLKFIPEDSHNINTTENLYIEGDNLEVLKLLRQNYYGAIKMIYIDPPYNTGNDFLYNDSFYTNITDSDIAENLRDNDGNLLQRNLKSTNRFHAKWLNMLYPRLKVAKDLLTSDGVILINMDENEIINLQKVCEEIFGDENELGIIVWDKRNPKGDAKGISYQHEYIVIFAKNKNSLLERCKMLRPKKNAATMINKAQQLFSKINQDYLLDNANEEFSIWLAKQKDFSGGEKAYNKMDKNGELFQAVSMSWPNKNKAPEDYFIPLVHPVTLKPCPIPERGWRNPSTTMNELLDKELIIFGKDETTQPRRKYLLSENMFENITSMLYFGGSDTDLLSKLQIPFDTPKVVTICMEHIKSFIDSTDIVLDFFSGSATTAHAVIQLNAEDGGHRKYIMVQVPELIDEKTDAYRAGYKNICDIGKERIYRAGNKIKQEIENKNKQLKINQEQNEIPDIGFKVFKTADTNIKWNLSESTEQINIDMLSNTPDLADFKIDAKDLDIVYELMLRQKDVPLSSPLEQLGEIGERTYLYASSYLVCLEAQISMQLINKLSELNPLPIKFIFRDSAFQDDIALKDETFRRLKALIEKNSGSNKKSYTVEFI